MKNPCREPVSVLYRVLRIGDLDGGRRAAFGPREDPTPWSVPGCDTGIWKERRGTRHRCLTDPGSRDLGYGTVMSRDGVGIGRVLGPVPTELSSVSWTLAREPHRLKTVLSLHLRQDTYRRDTVSLPVLVGSVDVTGDSYRSSSHPGGTRSTGLTTVGRVCPRATRRPGAGATCGTRVGTSGRRTSPPSLPAAVDPRDTSFSLSRL